MSPESPRMSFVDKIRMLAEWSPLLGQVQLIMASPEPADKAKAVIDALQFAATKSPTEIDDEFLMHAEAVLRSEEGQAFFAWVVEKVQGEQDAE